MAIFYNKNIKTVFVARKEGNQSRRKTKKLRKYSLTQLFVLLGIPPECVGDSEPTQKKIRDRIAEGRNPQPCN